MDNTINKMKNRKSDNTFVFKSFHELLNEVNISSLRRSEQQLDVEDDTSYFGEALRRWRELNCTQHFVDFVKELQGEVNSLLLIIHNEEAIVSSLERHLQIKNSLALEPLIDLTVQLSRDLQGDFYEKHFKTFFNIFVNLLNMHHHDVDVLKNVFVAFSFLFKSLQKRFLIDIEQTFELFCPLLNPRHYKDYINKFAAEAFSILMRKHKNLEYLLSFVLQAVVENIDLMPGVSNLICEMVKGLKHQFYSQTPQILSTLLDIAGKEKFDVDIVRELLKELWKLLCIHTNQQHSSIIVDCALQKMGEIYDHVECGDGRINHLSAVMGVVILIIKHKKGCLVESDSLLVDLTEKLLHGSDAVKEVQCEILDVVSSILISGVADQHRPNLLKLAFNEKYNFESILEFTNSIFKISLFEKDALINLMEYCKNIFENRPENVLHALTLFVTKKQESAICNRKSYLKYIPDFDKYAGDMISRAEDANKMLSAEQEMLWAVLICVPFAKGASSHAEQHIMGLIVRLVESAKHSTSEESKKRILCILRQAVRSLICLSDGEVEGLNGDLLTTLISNFAGHEEALDTVHLCVVELSCFKNEPSTDVFAKWFPHLQKNFMSPFTEIRRLTMELLSWLFKPQVCEENNEDVSDNIFRVCLEAEQFPATLHTFRDKLNCLEKLRYDLMSPRLPVGCPKNVPLKYLISQFYVNLQPLWDPVKVLVSSYAENLDAEEFWEVFASQLELAGKAIIAGDEHPVQIDVSEEFSDISLASLFHKECSATSKRRKSDRPSGLSFRENLWSCMLHFPQRCEQFSNVVVPLFFRFLDDEYKYAWDDVKYRKQESMLLEEKHARVPDRLLVLHLKLFAKFARPQSLCQKNKLFDLYMELLQAASVDVQKAAFSCLMTYKPAHLVPYRENFERLIDEKTFRDEMVMFTFDEEKCIVKAGHREGAVKVLLRILLGKLKMKIGKDATGRTPGQTRKITIITYLANFKSSEILILLDLFFASVLDLATTDVYENVKAIMSGDKEVKLSLKKQQSILANVELIFNKLGHKLDTYLPKILNILLCLGASCNHFITQKREAVNAKDVNIFRNIRSTIFSNIIQFFEMFSKIHYETNTIEALFHAIVWPQLKKMSSEVISNSSGLLKLLLCWTKYSRLHVLLAKTHPSEPSLAPLPAALSILKAANVDAKVVDVIFQIVENLLVEEEEEEEVEDGGMSAINGPAPGNVLDVSSVIMNSDVSYGMSLVVMFCMDILLCIERRFKFNNSKADRKKINSLSRELTILSKVSEYVADDECSEKLCGQLILMMSTGGKASAEIELKILTSIKHLVVRARNASKFLQPIGPLFGTISNAVSRTELSLIIQEMSIKDNSLATMSEIVTGMNTIDRTRLNEPNYMERMIAFSKASEYLKTKFLAERGSIDDILLLVHNCFFVLTNSTDRTLRDRALVCIEEIIKYSVEKRYWQSFIEQYIVPLLKVNLKINSEEHRHCMIKVLHFLVVHFKTNVHFHSMTPLCDFEDQERDFFLNIVHIQLHRRARALRKLAQFLQTCESFDRPPSKVLTSYLLPLALGFLKDKLYEKEADLLTAAVEAISSISKFLPWNSYVELLRYYIKLFDKELANQKLVVRIVVAILDSFHFDVQNLQPNEVCTEKMLVDDNVGEEEMDCGEDETEAMDVEHTQSPTAESIAVSKQNTGSDSGITSNVHKTMMNYILPALHRSLTQKARNDDQHKLAKAGKYAEDEDILRVPVALAMIKLLQKLSQECLDKNLRGIVLKLCYFLGSRAEDIRNIARDTIKKALISLGPSYLPVFFSEMKSHLTRGYQVHVLCFSIWSVLEEMNLKAKEERPDGTSFMRAGDLDECIPLLNEVFHKELFSDVSEEKEVDAIARKLFEARTTKSYDSYKLLAAWTSVENLPQLILPLKEVLDETRSHKVVNKVIGTLQKISQGLIEKKTISVEFLLTFIHGLISDTITNLTEKGLEAKEKEDVRGRSTFLLDAAPARGGFRTKGDSRANLHVLSEFGLNVLHLMFKHSFLDLKEKRHLEMLDPFLGILSKSLDGKHTTVCTASLKCLIRILRFPLPSISRKIKKIANKMFVLLKSYSTMGAGKNEHSEMIDWCYKALQVLIQFVTCHKISAQQLHTLLMFVERDIHDFTKHPTAFPLLHSILCRKLDAPELKDIMTTVEEMSVRSEMSDVQSKCRKAIMTYLLDYPLDSDAMEKHLTFFMCQLKYKFEMGRLSAMETINNVVNVFPQNILDEHSSLIFLRLVDLRMYDNSEKCHEMATQIIKLLVQKISFDARDKLKILVFEWMNSSEVDKIMAFALMINVFVEVEKEGFTKNLKTVLSALADHIRPDVFQQPVMTDSEQLERDMLLYHLLDAALCILKNCNITRDHSFSSQLNILWDHILVHCKYMHEPVMRKTAQLFNLLFVSWSPGDLVHSSLPLQEESETPKKKKIKSNHRQVVKEYLQIAFVDKLHKMLRTFCFQLSSNIGIDLANEICENLLYVLQIMIEIPEEKEDEEVTVGWLIKRLCKKTQAEVINSRNCSVKRNSIFVWLGAAAQKLGPARISKHVEEMIRPLIRELLDNTPSEDTTLKTLAQEVLDLIKSIVGVDEFGVSYAAVTKIISDKKIDVKASKALQATSNPELFAKRKIKKNLAKRESKKRKMQELKPYRSSKKRKVDADTS